MSYSSQSYSLDQSSNLAIPSGPYANDEAKVTDFMMSVAVISTADLAKDLKEQLLEYHKAHAEEYKYTLYVHVSEKMLKVLYNGIIHVDYFIILADPRRPNAVEKVKKDLMLLRPVFLATSRCVVAVSWPEGIQPHLVARCSAEVHKACSEKMLHKLVQREEGPSGKKNLASRLLRLARNARGMNASGVPNYTGCFTYDPHWDIPATAGSMQQSPSEDDDDGDEQEEDDEPLEEDDDD